MKVDDRLELTAEKLVAGGDALCRVDGFPVFVSAIFPGDRARLRVSEVKKGFARAELLELLEPGPERRGEPCPIAGICGGCDWTALRLDRQLHWKREILREALRRVGKIDPASLPKIHLHPSPLNYRLRSRLHVDRSKNIVGFYALRSHDVVEISDRCEVIGPLALKHLDEIRAVGREGHWAISLFEDERDLHLEAIDDDGARGNPPVDYQVGEHTFHLATTSFFQVNRHLLDTLLRRVTEIGSSCSRKESALDLYGGIGFFASALATLFAQVTTVESSPLSHRFASSNLPPERTTALLDDAERFLRKERGSFDFVMIDPPRSGASGGVIDLIAERAAEKVCYLSCDPVTFARDASRLMRRGWRLSSLDLVDLFPNTHHIETLSSFERER